jgi:hypothetical protein
LFQKNSYMGPVVHIQRQCPWGERGYQRFYDNRSEALVLKSMHDDGGKGIKNCVTSFIPIHYTMKLN